MDHNKKLKKKHEMNIYLNMENRNNETKIVKDPDHKNTSGSADTKELLLIVV